MHQTLKEKEISVKILFSSKITGKFDILLPKLFWTTVRKNWSSDWEKLLEFEAEGQEFVKFFRLLRTIYSNSEMSEQFLVTELVPGDSSYLTN